MFSLLAVFFVSSSLKLSEPALKSQDGENVSLKAWCIGFGCVMPFTPVTCLSWCDWTNDKQADAEARGAFSSSKKGVNWGKTTKATAFGWVYGGGADAVLAEDKRARYHFAKKFAPKEVAIPFFPGGDKETKLPTTELNCGQCYLIGLPFKCAGQQNCLCKDLSNTCDEGTWLYGMKVTKLAAGGNQVSWFQSAMATAKTDAETCAAADIRFTLKWEAGAKVNEIKKFERIEEGADKGKPVWMELVGLVAPAKQCLE